LRLQYEAFSSRNPYLRMLGSSVEDARTKRKPVPADNPLWQAQEQASEFIKTSLDAYRDMRDHMYEATFHAVYGSPMLQAMVGLKASERPVRERPGEETARSALVADRIGQLRNAIPEGGPREALLRALIYIRIPEGVVDERGFNFLRRMREEAGKDVPLAAFKQAVRDQFLMLLLDERRCIEAIPSMIDADPKLATQLSESLHDVISVVGVKSADGKARLREIEGLLEMSGLPKSIRASQRSSQPQLRRYNS
jgi:hypothetical protein